MGSRGIPLFSNFLRVYNSSGGLRFVFKGLEFGKTGYPFFKETKVDGFSFLLRYCYYQIRCLRFYLAGKSKRVYFNERFAF